MSVTANRDKVRLLIGDTSAADAVLSDDEIDFFITERTIVNSTGGTLGVNIEAAAADAAGAIAAEYARQFNFSEDGQSFQRAQRAGHYMALEKSLRARSGGLVQQLTLAGTETTS